MWNASNLYWLFKLLMLWWLVIKDSFLLLFRNPVASHSVPLWTLAHQSSLSLIISQSLPKFIFIASVMLSSHLILWDDIKAFYLKITFYLDIKTLLNIKELDIKLCQTLILILRFFSNRECGAGTFVNFASLERDGKLPYNWWVLFWNKSLGSLTMPCVLQTWLCCIWK